ncbi:MAG: signal peptidase II [Rhabdochlamydiaceae bacterium]
MQKIGLVSILFFPILIIDTLTKYLVSRGLPLIDEFPFSYPYGGLKGFYQWFGIDFCLVHAANKGAAWGWLSAYQLPLLGFRLIAFIFLILYIKRLKKEDKEVFSLTLVSAGALGNILDYFIYGHVVDMFYFKFFTYSYPIFNVADISIFLGSASFIFFQVFSSKKRVAK